KQNVSIDYVSHLAEVKVDQTVCLRGCPGKQPDLLLTLGSAIEQQGVTRARSYSNFGRTYVTPGQLPTERYQYLPDMQESELFRRPDARPEESSYHPDNFLPSRFILAAYGQAKWEITPSVTAIAGARMDRFSDFGTVVNPRGALVFAPTNS